MGPCSQLSICPRASHTNIDRLDGDNGYCLHIEYGHSVRKMKPSELGFEDLVAQWLDLIGDDQEVAMRCIRVALGGAVMAIDATK